MLTSCIPKVRWCLVFSRVEKLKRWWYHSVCVCLSVCVCGVVLFSLEHSKNLKLHAPKVSSRFFKGRYTKTRDNGTTLVPDLLAENFFWNPARAFIPRSVCLSVHPKIYKTLQYLTKPFSTWLNMKQILSPPPCISRDHQGSFGNMPELPWQSRHFFSMYNVQTSFFLLPEFGCWTNMIFLNVCSRVFQVFFNIVSRVLQGYFNSLSNVFQGCYSFRTSNQLVWCPFLAASRFWWWEHDTGT